MSGAPSGVDQSKQRHEFAGGQYQTIDSASDSKVKAASFSWWQQRVLVVKELRETLRDRRTVVTLLAMPLLLYPLLGLGFRFLALQQLSEGQPVLMVACNTPEEGNWLLEQLEYGKSVLEQADGQSGSTLSDGAELLSRPQDNPLARESAGRHPELHVNIPQDGSPFDLKQMVTEGIVDVGILVQQLRDSGRPELMTAQVQIFENRELSGSRRAADLIAERLAASNLAQIQRWAAARQPGFKQPIAQRRGSLVASESQTAVLGLLPLILLLMTVTGGVYPAIDLTAGERERNTLETLISLPIAKFWLLMAKYVAVVTVTLLTGMMNLLAMALTLYALQLDVVLLGENGFTWFLGVKLLAVLGIFALFYSGLLLMLTSSARSFKEAQAYLIPLLLLSIAPGLVILLPGWQLNQATAVLPLINILLLARDVLEGTSSAIPVAVAVGSTCFYAVAALALASNRFATDAVAVGSRGDWREWLRPQRSGVSMPTATMAWVGLAILFPAYFVASGIISRDNGISVGSRLILSGVLTTILFLALPAFLLRWEGVGLIQGLSWRWPKWRFLVGAVLLGLSAWPWIFELIVASHSLGIHGIDLSQHETVKKLLSDWQTVPLLWILLALGLAPGVCEECFFRGLLYNGLRQHLKAWGTIAATAFLFGLFHVVLAGGAAPERFIPSTLMGFLLGWVRWRSASLLPCVFLHSVHNSILLLLARYRDELSGWGMQDVMYQSHLPALWLGIAAVVFILGMSALFSADPSREIQDPRAN
jgi:ABC-2 type transport system permease protein/sodium transport system permease protein